MKNEEIISAGFGSTDAEINNVHHSDRWALLGARPGLTKFYAKAGVRVFTFYVAD